MVREVGDSGIAILEHRPDGACATEPERRSSKTRCAKTIAIQLFNLRRLELIRDRPVDPGGIDGVKGCAHAQERPEPAR